MPDRVAVTEELRAACTLPRLDWGSAFTAPISVPRPPQEWARAVFEGAPAALRRILPLAWRFGLGVHLGPFPAADYVLGNEIVRAKKNSVTLEMRSRFLIAQNVALADDFSLRWATFVYFRGRTGRLVWAAAAPVHQRTLPFLLRRAVS